MIELGFTPAFEGVDPHTHDDHVDAFLVLDGQVDFTVGDDVQRAGPGVFVAAVPGTRHGFRSEGHMTLLNLHAPDTGFAGRLRGND